MKKLLFIMLFFYALAAQAALQGVLDSANCTRVTGWAWDSTMPNTPIKVTIYNGNIRMQTLLADVFRSDLLAAGKGNGKHGFVYNLGGELKNGKIHKINVYYAGTTTPLTGSPKTTAVCTGALNDTGWQKCGNNSANNLTCPVSGYPRQDGDQGRDAKALAGTLTKIGAGRAGFDFTKIANNGSKLPKTATLGTVPNAWACTLDNVTGLWWEVKVDAGGLRDKDYSYSWYNPNPNTNGGAPGLQNGGVCSGGISCDTQGFVQAVNAQGLCGRKDWRLPNHEELRSIVSNDLLNPSIDVGYFPNTLASAYWTSSPEALSIINAWRIDFNNGSDNSDGKEGKHAVRLVRGGK